MRVPVMPARSVVPRTLAMLLGIAVCRSAVAQTPTPTPSGEFLCSAGPRDGQACNRDQDCAPGGACVIGQRVCNGGTGDRVPCDCAGTTGMPCQGTGTTGTCHGGTMNGGSCDPSNTSSTGHS